MPSLNDLKQSYAAARERWTAAMEPARSEGRARTSAEWDQTDAIGAEMQTLESEMIEAGMTKAQIDAIGSAAPQADATGTEDMRRTLQAMGITPRGETAPGLSPAQASMARTLEAVGIKPRLPGH